ncbi:glycogen debranching enzyme [Aspergillus saccharolyticus JOP 1030-1]|uniref:Glycogen debranching enzyme n=1 Tax=Aspergillus saccharolyticus JOP 1030-1 TaxID=1450539 RepID=A0A319AEK5_9EURO|nr:glycogen debranching enzyme [Aspergillus saccharolyticus JOP 1030-1]PYH49928.1 glycogen debranching enzyme [Aspergillus saccharolyticus JOP 1030-1]
MSSPRQVYLLPLKDDGSPDVPGGYIYLPPPSPFYTLRFVIEGTSSICRQGQLWVNIPEEGQTFNRSTFRSFRLSPDFNKNIQIDVPITSPGSFAFYVTFSPLPEFSLSQTATPEPTETPIYYIDVSPKLTLRGRDLPLNALSIYSVISKFMGKYPTDWDKHLNGISQRNYNMIHFTPLMKRGDSNSPYSIFDQLQFDDAVFPNGEADVAQLVKKMEEKYGLLSLTDVVWNHTANNSKWLEEHPEAGYSVATAPWLESALELDNALLKFGANLADLGLPTEFKSVDDLVSVMNAVREDVIHKLKLWEYYVVNVAADARKITRQWQASKNIDVTSDEWSQHKLKDFANWTLEEQASFIRRESIPTSKQLLGRFSRSVDSNFGAAILTALLGPSDTANADSSAAEKAISRILDEVNLPFYKEYDADVAEIMNQLFNRIKYLRIDGHGPKLGPVTKQSPLIETYFTRLPLNATTKKHDSRALALVNNGWIWNADALRDNAGPFSKAYLRREVIVWGDCVKLRYGSSPGDNPFLWEFMTKYTRLMAKYFSGFRIDNCHSTPLAVAEYLLDEARKVRPNLTVFAELFTGSEEADYIFVKRLGINALIREAMQAWSTGELSRLVHRHGGRPIGSFDVDLPSAGSSHAIASSGIDGGKEELSLIRPTPVQALFMDCTHDNEMPAQKRTAIDTLPNAALVAMCASAIGSVIGYDEIYPNLVDLVHETRLYSSTFSESSKIDLNSLEGGIGGIKKLLNELHTVMGSESYDETHIHHDGEYITVHRVHPKTRKGIFLIAHTAFPGQDSKAILAPTRLVGTQAKHIGTWQLEVDASENTKKEVSGDKSYLKGLPSRVHAIEGTKVEQDGNDTVISVLEALVAGSIALYETSIPSAEHASGLDAHITEGVDDAFANLNLVDLNFVLYRCEAEERDSSNGQDGVYNIPNHGSLVYAGLQGWWSVLENIIKYNELGHPLCDHLRNGRWALDYIVARLEKAAKTERYSALHKPSAWLREKFAAVRGLPSFLLPRYFAIIVQSAYNAAWKRGLQLLGDNIQKGQEFIHQLGMVSVQMTGYVNSASLWPTKAVPSLAAGLPHFAVDWARCWGRDVFISLRGLLLCTSRFDDAKEHIFAFASVLKHGMIPNLLGSGKLPRYNSRDSVWFFLQSIQDYTKMAPDGIKLLDEKIPRRFLPYDDTWFPFDDPRAYSKYSTISEVIQEVFQRHAQGLSFREYNAGPNLDMQMKSEGFDINVQVDWDTGLIFGGSQFNCGTWQDKMGESEKAKNKGVPGTPRDGAAVEITGLVYSALNWVATLHERGLHPHSGVDLGEGKSITFKSWAARIKENFERCYYIPLSPEEDAQYVIDRNVVNRRGIYKDLYKSGKPYEDYQLRSNFPIAMTVAPELFTPSKALSALALADKVLVGPVGMATLDPSDLNYRPYYNNSEDSDDFATAKGRNYHQGPEWVWQRGFFLRAFLHFDLARRTTLEERTEAYQQITRRLEGCKKALRESPWKGLTELSNKDGAYCADSLRYRNVDAIDYYEEKLRRIDEQIRLARQKEYPPTEIAFVTMESIAASQMVVQAILDPQPMQLLARLAPAPADVVWKNTYLPRSRRMMQSWSVTVIIGFLTVFWSVLLIPVAYLLEYETLHKVFPQLADALSRNPLAKSLVQTGLPTLVLSLLTVAVPYLYSWLSHQQGMMSRGDIELSVISKTFFFSFFNLFLVFTVFGTATTFFGFWENLRDAFKDATTIAFALAKTLENFAPFYINFLCLQGIGLFPFRLLEFGSVAMYPINFLAAKTPRDYAELNTPPVFSYGYSIPQTVLSLIICVVYSVFPSSWLICLFGLIYFVIGKFIYKYQLLYAMDHQQHSTGRAWPMICSRVLMGLIVFQLAMIGVLALRRAITRSLLIVPLLMATVWFSYFFSRNYEPLMKFIALKSIDRERPGGGDISPSPSSTFSPPSGLERDAFPIRIGNQELGLRLKKYVNPSLILPLHDAWLPGRSTAPGYQEDFNVSETPNVAADESV